jgi:cysteine-rich CWC protein
MKSTLTKIGSALSQTLQRQRVCESCGQDFSCGASLRGCWCSEISISDAARTELQGLYRDCLCRECLQKISDKEQTKTK